MDDYSSNHSILQEISKASSQTGSRECSEGSGYSLAHLLHQTPANCSHHHVLNFTTLEYPSGEVRYVWLYDANVEFLKGKHLYTRIHVNGNESDSVSFFDRISHFAVS